jgi:glutaredoxin
MSIIRAIIGAILLLLEALFSPKGIKRNPELQAQIDLETKKLTLYQFKSCPFCVKVRMAMKKRSLTIETRDAKRSDAAMAELLAGGGKLKVPCLKIEDASGNATWMYESSDIISYLDNRFMPEGTA